MIVGAFENVVEVERGRFLFAVNLSASVFPVDVLGEGETIKTT